MNNIIGADIIMNGKSIVGSMGSDGKIHYDKEEIKELIACLLYTSDAADD